MPHDTNELVQMGKQSFEKKEYDRAAHYFKQVVQKGVKYADVFNMLGVIDHIEGKFESAIDMFKEALKLNPHYTEAVLNLAVLYNDIGHYEDAKTLYAQLHKAKKTDHKHIEPVLKGKLSNLHANIGDIYKSLGLYSHAIEEYKKALTLNPEYVDIRTKLGVSHRENEEFEKSISELGKVTKSDPKYVHAHIQLGVTYYSMGKPAEANKHWKKALTIEPANEHAQMYLRLAEAKAKATSTKTKSSR